MADRLLPTAYFQGVFTIPKYLSSLTLGNRRAMYNLLFRAAGQAFCQLLAEARGIEAAPQLVLHTWDQRLETHAHVHLRQGICPDCGGGLRVTWSSMNRPSWSEVFRSPLAPSWYQSNGP